MFSKTSTTEYTENCSDNIKRLKSEIEKADAVVIGAGAGLSTSAGFVYGGERFKKYFADFEEKYGFSDMYAGGFYPYKTPEEMWAYWSKMIFVNRYTDAPKPVYNNLFELVKNKDYFVITTNVDHCFQKAGFDKNRLFYTQGDYGLFQCSKPCCNETFDNEEMILKMVNEQKNMRIPSYLIPKCPHCGENLTTNLRSDDKFVEDEGWHKAAKRYENFLMSQQGKRILFLELGVGYNTPSIIKYPFWRMTLKNPNAIYACLNMSESYCPAEISKQSICISADIGSVLDYLQNL
jgi:NAD-dependent SIR2 family protein deacetylase